MILTLLATFGVALQPAEGFRPLRSILAIESLGPRRRALLRPDPIEWALAQGTWEAPHEGSRVLGLDGEPRTWTRFEADEQAQFSGDAFRGGWAFARVDLPVTSAWRLEASGHSYVIVDGEPRAGDPYGLGITRVPLALEAGEHELLFRCGRGDLRVSLELAPKPVYFEDIDSTLPDIVRGEGGELWGAILVCNARGTRLEGASILAHVEGSSSTNTRLQNIEPSSYRKAPFRFEAPVEFGRDEMRIQLQLVDARGQPLHATEVELAVRDGDQKHARTFQSAVDGSVQYYAVVPRAPLAGGSPDGPAALVLSLHGAGVEARGQAACYAPKDWCTVVAPTNRRPFGFDWEDWGRLDALEVLELESARQATDPRRTYLTGHSMGGHGTWQLGAHFPSRFAAIAPSAGWRDFEDYGAGSGVDPEDPIGALLLRSTLASRTLALADNYRSLGIYVLHGDEDRSVPVSEARAMREVLGEFHPNFAYYERAGAGHWWGNECLDWPPLFDFLRRNERPLLPTSIDFTTVSPRVSSRCDWLAIEDQLEPFQLSRAQAEWSPDEGEVRLQLENVTRVAFDFSSLTAAGQPGPEVLRLSKAPGIGAEVSFELPEELRVTPVLDRGGDGAWRLARRATGWSKSPERYGPLKDGFRRRMVFVYGTQGTPEENAWARAKARFDHEVWRYRGNGSVELLPDTDFDADEDVERNVILYGNRDTNSRWEEVLAGNAFDLDRTHVRIGHRTLEGEDLALLAVYPRRGSRKACAVVIGGTGLVGARSTDHLPIFVSGVAYPDWTVLGAESLRDGLPGVRGAGFFRSDWSALDGAPAAWREAGK